MSNLEKTEQLSIRRPVKVTGLNVYNGRKNTVVFHPAREDSGLTFIVNNHRIPVSLNAAENKKKSITLTNNGNRVYLVEHLLSAVYALGIDNLDIELSDKVCPTTDNCAREYFDALKGSRISQSHLKKFWAYNGTHPTTVRDPALRREDLIKVSSSDAFIIDYFVFYPHKVVGAQYHSFNFDNDYYYTDISSARPPGFVKNSAICDWLGKLRLHGVTEKNYLWITTKDATNYANSEEFGVRYEGNEFVRHKILDVIGTLALTGRQFYNTKFNFVATGHKFDIYALKKLFNEGHFIDPARRPTN